MSFGKPRYKYVVFVRHSTCLPPGHTWGDHVYSRGGHFVVVHMPRPPEESLEYAYLMSRCTDPAICSLCNTRLQARRPGMRHAGISLYRAYKS